MVPPDVGRPERDTAHHDALEYLDLDRELVERGHDIAAPQRRRVPPATGPGVARKDEVVGGRDSLGRETIRKGT